MATRNVTVTETPFGKLVTWTGLLNGDDGQPLELTEYADRAMQVQGTFGASGSVSLEGSNLGTSWDVLADPQGSPLTVTAKKVEQVLETPRFVRPIVTAGDGTTSLTVTLYCRRGTR